MNADRTNQQLDRLVDDLALAQAGQPGEANVFRALELTRDEVRQSAFIAWLLAKNSPHQQGPALLERLARATGSEVDIGDQPYTVTREYAGLEAQIDVVVSVPGPPSLIVYVENKVDAIESDGRLESESRDVERLRREQMSQADIRKVFLTPGGVPGSAGEGWFPLSYEALGEMVEQLEPAMGEPWGALVRQWREALPSPTVPKSSVHIDPTVYALIRHELADLCNEVGEGMLSNFHSYPFQFHPFQRAAGQMHFTNLSPSADGLSVGVDRVWPESLLSGAPGTAPRLWVWHETDDVDFHHRFEMAVRENGATDGDGLLQPDRTSRRRQYLAVKWVGQYRLGEPSFAEQLRSEIGGFVARWLPIIEAAAKPDA